MAEALPVEEKPAASGVASTSDAGLPAGACSWRPRRALLQLPPPHNKWNR